MENGWYKKDSGVIIGYYGQNKELATFLPVAPDKYELVTRKNPQGVFIDDEIANNIDSDAFACYAGLPLKQLKTVDLMKFMFAQGWKSDFRAIFLASLVAGIIPLVTSILTNSTRWRGLCYQQPILLIKAKSYKVSGKGRCPNLVLYFKKILLFASNFCGLYPHA